LADGAVDSGPTAALDAGDGSASGGKGLFSTTPTVEPMLVAPQGVRVSCATSGTEAFAIWSPQREQFAPLGTVYGARIAADGSMRDPVSIPVVAENHSALASVVTFAGGHWVVVWQETSNVFAARVGTDGVIVGSPTAVGTTRTDPQPLAVASNGAEALVTWPGDSDNVVRIDGATGAVLSTTSHPMSQKATDTVTDVAIAWNGTEYLVAWVDVPAPSPPPVSPPTLYAGRLSTTGGVVDATPLSVTSDSSLPKSGAQSFGVASDGANFFVVWSAGGPITGRPVTNGVLGGSVAVGTGSAPSVTFDGTNYVVASQLRTPPPTLTPQDVMYATRVTPTGTVLDQSGIGLSARAVQQTMPCITRAGAGSVTVYDEALSSDPEFAYLAGAQLSAAGVPIASIAPVSRTANLQDSPAIASSGTGSLVVYNDYAQMLSRGSNRPRLVGTRLDAAGQPLEPRDIVISSDRLGSALPLVDFDGANYFVLWNGHAIHVSPSGQVIEEASIAVSTPRADAIAFGQGVHLVVYFDEGQVWASRVKTDGTNLDVGGFRLSSPADPLGGVYGTPQVVFDGSVFVVAWGVDRVTHMARVDAAGNVSAQTTLPALFQTDFNGARYGALGCRGPGSCALTWADGNLLSSGLSADNALLDPGGRVVASVGAELVMNVGVGFDGTSLRAQFLSRLPAPAPPLSHYRDVVLADGAGAPTSLQDGTYKSLSVGGIGGRPIAVHARFVTDLPYATWRIGAAAP
jgi:hypothetical protein